MPAIVCSLGAFTVASIFYTWRAHYLAFTNHRRQLHDRVAFLLWTVANQAP
jgi:hypothetical protein